MDSQRWAQIKLIFFAAAELPAEERSAFIRSGCGGDESLAVEIESLLAAHDQAGSFIEAYPDDEATLALEGRDTEPMIGRRIGAYQVIREIGRGGMGAVYLAARADGAFQKKVAIKVIKHHIDSELLIRRFRNERQILADLDHPNIARLLDGGTTDDGLPYLVMEYIDGDPIDQYCDAKKLTTIERLELFHTVCSGIHHAHQRSIVHRDIKPGNILITVDGTPKLLDFGIAKLLDPELSPDTLDSTATDLRLMTLAYASPEQVRGEPITSVSDVYTLGVLLYELLTGHRPYVIKSRKPYEIVRAICDQEPEPPSSAVTRREEIPTPDGKGVITLTAESVSKTRDGEPEKLRKLLEGDIDRIVLTALSKQPDRRYASVQELSEDIGRHLGGHAVIARKQRGGGRRAISGVRWKLLSGLTLIIAVLLIAGLLFYFPGPKRAPISPLAVKSIAVLPFKSLGQEAGDEYLGEGLADSLITKLSNVRTVIVRPTSAVLKYSGRDQDPLATGRELKVDALLDGSIQKSGGRIRVTVQLVRVSDGASLWAYKCDDLYTDLFEVQDSISEKAVGALLLKLTSEERKLLTKRYTENLEAYELYLKGRYYWNKRTPDDLNRAADYFQQALDIDPTYALAYAGLADTYSYRGYYFGRMPPKEAMPRARAAAERAVELDDTLAEARAALGFARFLGWDFAGAESQIERSIKLNPNYPPAHYFYAGYLAAVSGSIDEAIAEANRGVELDPMSFPLNYFLGYLLFEGRRYDAAIQHFRKMAEIFPESPGSNVHWYLSSCYFYKGMQKEAFEEHILAMKISGASEASLRAYRRTYATSGFAGAKRKHLEEQVAEWKQDQWHGIACDIANGYSQIGEKEQALAWLEKAYDARASMLVWLKVDPDNDSLRSDPRFQDLIRRVGLPQ